MSCPNGSFFTEEQNKCVTEEGCAIGLKKSRNDSGQYGCCLEGYVFVEGTTSNTDKDNFCNNCLDLKNAFESWNPIVVDLIGSEEDLALKRPCFNRAVEYLQQFRREEYIEVSGLYNLCIASIDSFGGIDMNNMMYSTTANICQRQAVKLGMAKVYREKFFQYNNSCVSVLKNNDINFNNFYFRPQIN